jgi:hypothetical protein
MKFVTLMFSLTVLPLMAGGALAATPLSETQMDRMTAGAGIGVVTVLPMICANCTVSSSSSTSQNGVTTTHGGSGTDRGGLFMTTPLAPWGIGTVQIPIIVIIP